MTLSLRVVARALLPNLLFQRLVSSVASNRLVHEYMESPDTFAEDLVLAKEYSTMFIETYNRLRKFATARMRIDESKLPETLTLPGRC